MRLLAREILRGLAAGLGVVVYLLPYFYLSGTWWRALPSTCIILLLGAAWLRRDMPGFLGLQISWRQLGISVALFLLLLPVVDYVLFDIVVVEPLRVQRHFSLRSQVHQFFQVFNDEVVLRGALLTLLLRAFPHPRGLVVVTAFFFAIGHRAFYALGSIEVEWLALLTLFSFAGIANCLFLRYCHIGYGVALHFSWNVLRFNNGYFVGDETLTEGMTFNYIEGNAWLALMSSIAFGVVFSVYWRSIRTS